MKKTQKEKTLASWGEWNARDYLESYFSKLGPDPVETIRFLTEKFKELKGNNRKLVLDFGAGPTAFISLVLSPYCQEIHLSDYLPSNLIEIRKWLTNEKGGFDWGPCCQQILVNQGVTPNSKNLKKRMDEARAKTKKMFICNADLDSPILFQKGSYDVVTSIFCPESATDSKEKWGKYMSNISSLVKMDGIILLSCLRKCRYYKVGGKLFPSANIDEVELSKSLSKNGFLLTEDIKVIQVPKCYKDGFKSIMFASAKRYN